MKTEHTGKTIADGFILDFKGIFTQSEFKKKPLKSSSIRAGFFTAFIASAVVIILNVNLYTYISEIQSVLIQLIPGLLGFTIAGYSFLMGFIQPRLMERMAEPLPDEQVSLYQSISASLALNILFHAFFLILAYIIHFIVFIQDKTPSIRIDSESIATILNMFGVLLMNICLFCSLAVIIQIILSSFNLSQLNHYDTNKDKLERKIKAAEEERLRLSSGQQSTN